MTDNICFYCFRWKRKNAWDHVSGNCARTKTDTPPRFGCDWWINHEGDISEAERIALAVKKAEEEKRRQRALLNKLFNNNN